MRDGARTSTSASRSVARPNAGREARVPRRALCLAFLIPCVLGLGAAAGDDFADAECQHGVSYFGDFKYPQGFAHFDYVNPDAPKGGTLVRSVGAGFNNFTPFIAKGVSVPGITVIGEQIAYDSLMRPSDDEVGVFYGNLAGCIEVNDDVTEVRMVLRDEARWHDGAPVTATDVKFTFEHIRDHAFPGVKAAFAPIEEVVVQGAKDVLFRFRWPMNVNVVTALGKVAILPEHYWRDRDNSATTIEAPLSSGPYRVGRFELGKFIEFQRVDDYWARDFGFAKGQHNLDVIRYEVYRDATVQREALRKGLIDVFFEGNAALWATGYDLPARDQGLLELRIHDYHEYMGIIRALAFNLTKPRFQDVRVREALTLAFDFDWMNDVLDYGTYERPESFFHGTFLNAGGLPTAGELELLEPFRDQLPERVFTEPPFAESGTGRLRGRQALLRAQALLADAGWTQRPGAGLVNEAGEVFEVEFLVAGPARELLPYIARLERLGIAARIRVLEAAQYINMRRQNKGDAVFGSLATAMPPNQEVAAYYASNSHGNANFARLASPVVDALVARVLSATDRDSLLAASRALDRVLYWGFYFIPVRAVEGQRLVLWSKFGKPETLALSGGFPATWWWDPTRAARVEKALTAD